MTEKLEEIEISSGTTDYIAVNGPRMAKVMRGRKLMLKPQEFRSTTGKLGSFWRLVGFMFCSMILHIPGKKTTGDVLKFEQPSTVTLHAEGESEQLENVQKIEVKKSEKPLKVVDLG